MYSKCGAGKNNFSGDGPAGICKGLHSICGFPEKCHYFSLIISIGRVLAGMVLGLIGVSGISGSCVVLEVGVGGVCAGVFGDEVEPLDAAVFNLRAQPNKTGMKRIAINGIHLFVMM
jgi:hypothetical protein